MPTRKNATRPARAADGRVLRRQGQATRGKLLDAAVPALAENGYHATRVDDVVRLAGVSHGTFYLYFADKEELFRALAEACADEAAELAGRLGDVPPGDDGLTELRRWIAEFLDFYRRYGVVIRCWTENQVADRQLARLGRTSFARIAETLRSRLADGANTAGDDRVRLKAAALLAMLERFSYVVTSRDLGFDDAAAVDTLARLVHRGFFAAPANA